MAEVASIDAAEIDPRSHRSFVQLIDYWDKQRGGRFAPSRDDIDPLDFPRLLAPMMLADVVTHEPPDFRYRLCGTGIVDVHGADLTGKRPRDLLPEAYGQLIHQHYCELVERRAPIAHEILFDTEASFRLYARLLLPLSDNADGVTMIWALDQHMKPADSKAFFQQFSYSDNPA